VARPKGSSGNKSQEIRDYLTEHNGAKAKEVIHALATKGVTVNSALVYSVMGSMKERTHRKARVIKAAKAATNRTNGAASKSDVIALIVEVKAMAAKAGGYDKLKQLVEAMAG